MGATNGLQIERVAESRLGQVIFDNLVFGKHFSDHMLEADYKDGAWGNVRIRPYQPLTLDPSISGLHYGQSIFEGIKAYRLDGGNVAIFRPRDNFTRFNISAERMCMPTVPEEIFMDGLKELISIDQKWIPDLPGYALYIRPFMFATDPMLGVRPSNSYKFLIILSPVGVYSADRMKIVVEEKYTRAVKGGVGFSKNAGNYGSSLLAVKEVQKEGYDQVLWTDAHEHKWLQEVGMMNVFFVVNDTILTPSLEDGTILKGVTRDSAITLAMDLGFKVEERKINIDELVAEYEKGNFTEAFGAGTAATIAVISELKYKDLKMQLGQNGFPKAVAIKKAISNIRYGNAPDTYNWLLKVN